MEHLASSGRRRLDRVNALGRNNSYVPSDSEDDTDLTIHGGDDESVSNLLNKIGITRPDMLGISAAAWEAGMSRLSSGEFSYRSPPISGCTLTRSLVPTPPTRSSIEIDRNLSLDKSTMQPSPVTSSPESNSTFFENERGDAPVLSDSQNYGSSGSGGSVGSSGGEDKNRSLDSQASDERPPMDTIEYEEQPTPKSALTTRLSWNTWKKLEQLGSGSFGSVYRAVSSDGNFFAVKEVDLRSANEESAIQLQQEIALLGNFRHENIVQYLGTQRGHEKLYIFLELVTQGSLVSQYKHFKLFDVQLRKYTKQILCGLKYLHEMKVVHRDIKCGNILVHADGIVKLADFGMAKQLENIDSMRSCKGSVYWMAPEVINPKKTAGFPADIWSLGCTVLEMATGKPPFSDWEWNRVLFNVGRGMSKPEIPDFIQGDARDFISECLQVEPLKRPTAAKLLDHPFVNSFPVTTAADEFVEMVDDQSSYESLNVATRVASVRLGRSVRTVRSIYQNT